MAAGLAGTLAAVSVLLCHVGLSAWVLGAAGKGLGLRSWESLVLGEGRDGACP